MSTSYYDIDAILAEEDLLPCTTQFDFSYCAYLDPENAEGKHYLPKNSRIKMSLWAVQKWATLGFVRMNLPRHFQRKFRERLDAAPADVNLRKRNERFFLTGRFLVDVMEQTAEKNQSRRSNNRMQEQMDQLLKDARHLRETILMTYSGERLRMNLDWSLSSFGDDVSSFTSKLTEMERRLFHRGSAASAAHVGWKLNDKCRSLVTRAPQPKQIVTPEQDSSRKRRRE